MYRFVLTVQRCFLGVVLLPPAARDPAGPKEVKAILQTAMQLMPADRPPAAGQQPDNSSAQQQQWQASSLPGTPASHNKHQHTRQQYPHLHPHLQPSPQQPFEPRKALNGVEPRPVNGMEPLGRWEYTHRICGAVSCCVVQCKQQQQQQQLGTVA